MGQQRIPKPVSERTGENMAARDAKEQEKARTKNIGKLPVEVLAELDDVLEEIDKVLEENAEDFVKAYVQKGGE